MKKYTTFGIPYNTEIPAQRARINENIGWAAFDLEKEHVT